MRKTGRDGKAWLGGRSWDRRNEKSMDGQHGNNQGRRKTGEVGSDGRPRKRRTTHDEDGQGRGDVSPLGRPSQQKYLPRGRSVQDQPLLY